MRKPNITEILETSTPKEKKKMIISVVAFFVTFIVIFSLSFVVSYNLIANKENGSKAMAQENADYKKKIEELENELMAVKEELTAAKPTPAPTETPATVAGTQATTKPTSVPTAKATTKPAVNNPTAKPAAPTPVRTVAPPPPTPVVTEPQVTE